MLNLNLSLLVLFPLLLDLFLMPLLPLIVSSLYLLEFFTDVPCMLLAFLQLVLKFLDLHKQVLLILGLVPLLITLNMLQVPG